ncbi:hypothetical protein [Bacillus sp. OK048]|uniref:hypothetical protein n=1 Tax=Bacillus sp. OK048 TaxID=1882761 RepID=UPI0008897682|nr:hypothetical protein [Bacillus sp. OK048]SDL88646.1 hypothetical protein SAMN05443253_10145 [Bacillus sp. OK048]
MAKKTTSSDKKQTSIQGGVYPSQKYVPGGSVDEHKEFEDTNIMLAGDEILQQNENL